jgi:membrane associated rhomboid family serine protease
MDDRRVVLLVLLSMAVALWLFSLFASHASGWRKLARAYRARGPFEGRRWPFVWAAMEGETRFPGGSPWLLRVGANRHGLRLDVSVFLVPAAPPLFIPWSDVGAHYGFMDRVSFEVVELSFARVPEAPLRIRESLARMIASEVGSAFPWSPAGGPSPAPRRAGASEATMDPTAPREEMRCPKCGLEQPRSPECAGCGIVIARYQAGRRSPEAEPSAEAAAELDSHLAAATPRVRVTPALIAANLAVFAAMLAGGIHPLVPSTGRLLEWGANYGPRTTAGEWWRLATCMFVHIGVFHLGFNMAVLWGIGGFVERLTGSAGMLVVYLVSGLLASAASIAWNPYIVSAGASGAVFGVYGALLGFLARRRSAISSEAVRPLQKSALVFVAFNVVYGLGKQGIDLAAHLGGLAAGFACGLVLAAPLTAKGVAGRSWRNLELVGLGLVAVWGAAALLPRGVDLLAEMDAAAGLRAGAIRTYDAARGEWKAGRLTGERLAEVLEAQVLPEWQKSRERLDALHARLPAVQQERIEPLRSYLAARQKGWEGLAEALREGDAEKIEKALVRDRVGEELARMQRL